MIISNFRSSLKFPGVRPWGRGVYLVTNEEELAAYNARTPVAYIQAYLPIDRDIRVIIIGKKVVHAYWRIAPPGDFRNNVAVGATISLDPIPDAVFDFALHIAKWCRWDDVGIDVCLNKGQCYVLEANMKYGKEGFRAAGIDYIRMMEALIDNGDI